MTPTHKHSAGRSATALALVLVLAAVSTTVGCVYRPDIQQGNLLAFDEVHEVKPGMTRSQVRYILGTPMVSDPFFPDRWDYIYTFQRGRDRKIDRSHFVVHFEGDKVSRVEKLDLPEETPTAKRVRQQREAKAATEAAKAPAAPAAPGTSPAPAPVAPTAEPPPVSSPDTPPSATQPPSG